MCWVWLEPKHNGILWNWIRKEYFYKWALNKHSSEKGFLIAFVKLSLKAAKIIKSYILVVLNPNKKMNVQHI